MVIDAGELSQLTFSSDTVNSGWVTIANEFGTSTMYINDLSVPVQLSTSGINDITMSAGLTILQTSMSAITLLTQNFLFGLAGIAAGWLMGYVMVKYAV
jgi:hypothetical protein